MRKTILDLYSMASKGEKIAMLTCYDSSFARVLEQQGIDAILIGDSLGMVVQGHDSPVPVTLDDIVYHTQCVCRGSKNAFILSDMPFGSSQVSPQETFKNAVKLIQAGAQMVKIEGGMEMCDTVQFLVKRGIPVCAHIGLTPQSVNQVGGFKVQGRAEKEAQYILHSAKLLEEAGASLLLIEAVPYSLANQLCEHVSIPTIGIGASPQCSGQVLVIYDMLGLGAYIPPRFVKAFIKETGSIEEAVKLYVNEVKSSQFPALEHCYN
ncbi:3-methyl-2-oxobutanoate hydroxymethyltransferase [Ferrovum sp. PN-J185]|uniref:3-methyl-2-oxobutanoate hydroxymethyltransferase n=1 Tax=Ferrovum sp. PN-J185 TaxID=1356306 RepID=UPI0007951E16|nr:3-methyl-2-oxobutanoate hydroxymethyltransferase [Ferrovum sp. PN-J185]KXW56779.1 3-methyl-2-oxobutanoate hydroxymethyltransferase [Ferrovum sp. PN-J185]MCC6067727.1 3-methyl-2-oxobutanoate hydroxymethyltransferase [Ferrovum sp. PN-J185]MDE1891347.1 3-methyl-2-oxobutanoate hydroxymethyltransferase [Betaproteobacteria bacterium]MDE2056127.1 3-methyl-2-oxobutanoate hydroxymethyltransferase [Betaproteobacteria bacterium]